MQQPPEEFHSGTWDRYCLPSLTEGPGDRGRNSNSTLTVNNIAIFDFGISVGMAVQAAS